MTSLALYLRRDWTWGVHMSAYRKTRWWNEMHSSIWDKKRALDHWYLAVQRSRTRRAYHWQRADGAKRTMLLKCSSQRSSDHTLRCQHGKIGLRSACPRSSLVPHLPTGRCSAPTENSSIHAHIFPTAFTLSSIPVVVAKLGRRAFVRLYAVRSSGPHWGPSAVPLPSH